MDEIQSCKMEDCKIEGNTSKEDDCVLTIKMSSHQRKLHWRDAFIFIYVVIAVMLIGVSYSLVGPILPAVVNAISSDVITELVMKLSGKGERIVTSFNWGPDWCCSIVSGDFCSNIWLFCK